MKKVFIFVFGIILTFTAFSQTSKVQSVLPEEFKKGIDKKDIIILDVRTPQEFAQGHIEGAINIDFYNPQFYSNIESQLKKSDEIYIYCRSGNRSIHAAKMMEQKGYSKIIDLKGGKNYWLAKGFAFVK